MAVDSGQNLASRSRIRWFIRLLIFRIIPLLLLLAVMWSGFRVVQVFAQRWGEFNQYNARQDMYRQTATAIASVISSDAQFSEVIRVAQVFATNTPDAANVAPENQPEPPNAVAPEAQATRTPVPLPTFFPPSEPERAELSGTAVPTQVPTIPRNHELVNILLLGGDDELTNDGFLRTDSMIIVSINLDTRTVSMLSLPRDLFVYIPNGSIQRLNTAYGIGEAIGWSGGGFGLLRQTIFYNLGVNVHYFARINFSEFVEIIDTLGGIDVPVDCPYQDFYPVDDFDLERPIEENYYLRTLPIGYYRMDGELALWYARTRKLTDDFDRGRRQQQLLRAIYRRALETGGLANIANLWEPLTQIVETDLALGDVLGLLPIALSLDTGSIESFTMIRTYHTTPWQPPDGQFVQVLNYDPVRDLLIDFYTPPTENQIALGGPKIAVYNGTENPDWDLVAAERLRWEGFNGIAFGRFENTGQAKTTLIDRTGQEKGSLVSDVASALKISFDNIFRDPDPSREVDYEIILGADYNSCTFSVLPITN